jgi:hypothetical protein
MAKIANELDLRAIQAKLTPAAKKEWKVICAGLSDVQEAVLKKLWQTPAVTCCIYTGSVTFRIGTGSVKGLAISPAGFKTSFSPKGTTASDIFLKKYDRSFAVTSTEKFIITCAFYFLIHAPDRVKTESDKTEASEGQQVLATQAALKALVKEYGEIRLKIGDNSYNVDEFSQYTAGRPKADATFKYKGVDVVWLSLKKGGKPADWQQYGGSADLGIVGGDVTKFPDIKLFADNITKVFEALGVSKGKNGKYDFNSLDKGSYFGMPLKNHMVACKVMYGKDFGPKFGINNCNVCVDGDLKFIKARGSNEFELGGEYHISVNPYEFKSPKFPKYDPADLYSPVLFVTKAQNVNQIGFDHARFYIWPQNVPAKKGIQNLDESLNTIASKNKSALAAMATKFLPSK